MIIKNLILISLFAILVSCRSNSPNVCPQHPPLLSDLGVQQHIYFEFERSLSDGKPAKSDMLLRKDSVEFIKGKQIRLNRKEIDHLDSYFACSYNRSGPFFHHETNFYFKLNNSKKTLCKWKFRDVVGCPETDIIRASLNKSVFVNSPTKALWRDSNIYFPIAGDVSNGKPPLTLSNED